MFLVGHASVGIAITTALGITNPAAAFALGWASHYLADFFPHGDEPIGAWAKKGNEVLRLFLLLVADGLVFLSVFAIYVVLHGWSWWAAAAAIGSFVPDIAWGLAMALRRALPGPFPLLEKFHSRNHNFFHPHIPAWVGMAQQLFVAFLLWRWLL